MARNHFVSQRTAQYKILGLQKKTIWSSIICQTDPHSIVGPTHELVTIQLQDAAPSCRVRWSIIPWATSVSAISPRESRGTNTNFFLGYPLVNQHNRGKSPCLMERLTIAMVIFQELFWHNQRVLMIIITNHHSSSLSIVKHYSQFWIIIPFNRSHYISIKSWIVPIRWFTIIFHQY